MTPTPPGQIRGLAATVANQPAAGGVIERSTSVVKELVENAIDAGAKRILVEIEGGGTQETSVATAASCGVAKEDILLARIRHRFGISSSFCCYWMGIGSRSASWVVQRYARRLFGAFQERFLPIHRATLTWMANGGRAPPSARRRCTVNAVHR